MTNNVFFDNFAPRNDAKTQTKTWQKFNWNKVEENDEVDESGFDKDSKKKDESVEQTGQGLTSIEWENFQVPKPHFRKDEEILSTKNKTAIPQQKNKENNVDIGSTENLEEEGIPDEKIKKQDASVYEVYKEETNYRTIHFSPTQTAMYQDYGSCVYFSINANYKNAYFNDSFEELRWKNIQSRLDVTKSFVDDGLPPPDVSSITGKKLKVRVKLVSLRKLLLKAFRMNKVKFDLVIKCGNDKTGRKLFRCHKFLFVQSPFIKERLGLGISLDNFIIDYNPADNLKFDESTKSKFDEKQPVENSFKNFFVDNFNVDLSTELKNEKKFDEIELDDVNPDDFKIFYFFIYGEEKFRKLRDRLLQDYTFEIFKLAQLFGVSSFIKFVKRAFLSVMSCDNWFKFLIRSQKEKNIEMESIIFDFLIQFLNQRIFVMKGKERIRKQLKFTEDVLNGLSQRIQTKLVKLLLNEHGKKSIEVVISIKKKYKLEASFSKKNYYKFMKKVFTSKIFWDCSILSKDSKVIKAHKYILLNYSTKFESKFEETQQGGVFCFDEFESETILDFLSLLYLGEFRKVLSSVTLLERYKRLFFFASKYQLLEIENLCLKEILNSGNAMNFLLVLKEKKYKIPALVMNNIRDNFFRFPKDDLVRLSMKLMSNNEGELIFT